MEADTHPRQSRSGILWRQCLCVVLAYTMFIDPGLLLLATQASITYSYDSLTDELLSEDNGSLVAEYNDVSAVRDYGYSLRERLSSVTASGVTVSYSYDADGFRVAADNGTTAEYYLVDPFNQTGLVFLGGLTSLKRCYRVSLRQRIWLSISQLSSNSEKNLRNSI